MRGEILKRVLSLLAVILAAVLLFSVPAAADSYTYNYKQEAVPTPEAASVAIYADRAHMDLPGNGTLKDANDVDVDDNGNVYIADTGNIMPPKTTWFEPKLRSGLVIHKLD